MCNIKYRSVFIKHTSIISEPYYCLAIEAIYENKVIGKAKLKIDKEFIKESNLDI